MTDGARTRATSRCWWRTGAGWRNLCRLLTRAHAHTRAAGGRARHRPAVRAAGGGARARGGARLPERLRAPGRAGRADAAPAAGRLRAGPACGSSCSGRSSATTGRSTAGSTALARRLGVPCVATGNVHAHSRERALLQDAFVAIREHATLDASEPLRRGNHAHVLASPRAMAARFADHPGRGARRRCGWPSGCAFDLSERPRLPLPRRGRRGGRPRARRRCARTRFDGRYPVGHALPGRGAARAWTRSCGSSASSACRASSSCTATCSSSRARWRRRCAGPDTARALLPPGRGRGSSVSSIVCYLTGLSHIDPIENELFLGRFLNEELTALPDIDLDFPRDIREQLIPRVHERYGREHSALVAAFPTYRSRGAIREIGKALGLPPGEIERVARVAEPWAQAVEEDVNLALGAAAEAAEGTQLGAGRHGARGAAAGGRQRPVAARPAALDRRGRRHRARSRAMGVATTREGGPDPALARVAVDGNSGTALAVLTAPMLAAAEAAGSVGGAIRAAAARTTARGCARPRAPSATPSRRGGGARVASTTPTGTRARGRPARGGRRRRARPRPRAPSRRIATSRERAHTAARGARSRGRRRRRPGRRRARHQTAGTSQTADWAPDPGDKGWAPGEPRRGRGGGRRRPARCRAAGAGCRSWPGRRTGCRATCPSTPAG